MGVAVGGSVRNVVATLMLAVLAVPHWAVGQGTEKGQAICYQIEKTVNALVDYTQTSCIPTRGMAANSQSFIVLSSQPVFSVETSKKAWILVAVAATGDALNKSGSVKADELWLSDANQMKARTAYVMPVSLARNLHRQVKAEQISLDEMYGQIIRNLSQRNIPKK